MNRIKIVFGFTTVSLIVLIVIQILFLKTTYNERREIFDDEVSLLLKNIREALDPGEPLPEEFRRLLSERRYKKRFPLLEKKIASYTRLKNVKYSIYNRFRPSFVLGDTFESKYSTSLRTDNIIVKLGFPSYGIWYFLQKMWIHILVSILFTVLLIISSYYTIFMLIKQYKFSKTKEQFINTMTHELKTPIFSISVAVKTMFEFDIFKKDEKLKRYLNLIYSENERLKNNTNRVLETSLLKSGKIEFSKEIIDVHSILDTLIEELKLIGKNVDISKRFEATEYFIEMDPMHLKNVAYNIFDNSMKYSEKDLEFTITTVNTGKNIIMIFADNGIGISKRDQKNVFNEFYRVNTENIHNIKGYGIGLSYVKMVVEQFNGSVLAEGKDGTQIKIVFPVV
ncbi:HAMP domain-containing sensor histidine kinase [Winogradskyella sp.]|uniref:sensor histidine kinase n=1 Tax=Winogradskyella sp. TaxID=1883156 RepID=UPI00260292BA|nr:HAMP domain-containing sensor histidine kinase [Winogradskyella sp.]